MCDVLVQVIDSGILVKKFLIHVILMSIRILNYQILERKKKPLCGVMLFVQV
jgi:hypothetical protein